MSVATHKCSVDMKFVLELVEQKKNKRQASSANPITPTKSTCCEPVGLTTERQVEQEEEGRGFVGGGASVETNDRTGSNR
ncbi:hypothetical protein INR49_002393 [Caranx melampygus]|nr:hypothetical protein INR49_002393 [Caranx melampygus]